MTAKELANAMLAHLNLSLTDEAVTAAQKDALVRCLNGGYQEMRKLAPAAFKVRKGVVFTGAQSAAVTVDVATNQITFSGAPVPAGGASVRLAGDQTDNEIASVVSGTVFKLLYPLDGLTIPSPTTCTFYGDCVLLDEPVELILGEPKLANGWPLQVFNSRQQFLEYNNYLDGTDYGQRRIRTGRIRGVDLPAGVWLEVWNDTVSKKIEYRLHVAPLPSGRFACDLEVVLKPTPVTIDDLASDEDFNFLVPSGHDETLLKPLVMNQWMSEPWPRPDASTRAKIEDQYRDAQDKIRRWRGNASAGGVLRVGGY